MSTFSVEFLVILLNLILDLLNTQGVLGAEGRLKLLLLAAFLCQNINGRHTYICTTDIRTVGTSLTLDVGGKCIKLSVRVSFWEQESEYRGSRYIRF